MSKEGKRSVLSPSLPPERGDSARWRALRVSACWVMVVTITQGGSEVDMSNMVDRVGWYFVRRIDVTYGYLDSDTASDSHSKTHGNKANVFTVHLQRQ